MLENLINTGKKFEGKFTQDYMTAMGIDKSSENEYLKWIGKLGVYSEAKLKERYPDMTDQILSMVKKQSIYEKDYEIIMGYLESVNELENEQ